jgi:hypothetical protein
MKMKKYSVIVFVAFFVIAVLSPQIGVRAQGPSGSVIYTTLPVDPELRARVDTWLAASPPVSEIYYAITYTQQHGLDAHYVSLVALRLQSPDESWSFTGDEEDGVTKVAWFGTVLVYDDGSVEPYSTSTPETSSAYKLAIPLLPVPASGAGGGSYVRFPWQPSKAVKFGILGVHTAGYSLSATNWRAVDLVSGSDMGNGAANDQVYASVSGEVDYVCQDSQSVAIKVSGGGDSFLYAHLLDNANLTIGHAFSSGSVIGSLKHGSFAGDLVGNCGWAVQTAEHWHLHWGFQMADSRFQAEGCILTQALSVGAGDVSVGTSGVWQCGNTQVHVNDLLTHYGNIPGNDTGSQSNNQNFFDYLILGFKGIFDALIGNTLPEHNSEVGFIAPLLNGVKIVFRIVNILIRGNFNLAPAATMVVLTIGFRAAVGLLFIAAAIMRIVKSIPMIP